MSRRSQHDVTVLTSQRHRLQMGDVDAAQVMWFANPYRWHDGLFAAWLVGLGHGLLQQLREGSTSPAIASRAAYHSPLWLDMEVDLRLCVEEIGSKSFTLRMDGYRVSDGICAVQTWITHVWVATNGESMKSESLPEWLRSALDPEGAVGGEDAR